MQSDAASAARIADASGGADAAGNSGAQTGAMETGARLFWRDACALEDIVPGTGAPALIDGAQVAIVRMSDGATVYAVGNFDPFSKANVMARGIVGDRAGVPKLASPIYKQTFDLRTGVCFEDPAVALPSWPARVRETRVEVLWPRKDVVEV